MQYIIQQSPYFPNYLAHEAEFAALISSVGVLTEIIQSEHTHSKVLARAFPLNITK